MDLYNSHDSFKGIPDINFNKTIDIRLLTFGDDLICSDCNIKTANTYELFKHRQFHNNALKNKIKFSKGWNRCPLCPKSSKGLRRKHKKIKEWLLLLKSPSQSLLKSSQEPNVESSNEILRALLNESGCNLPPLRNVEDQYSIEFVRPDTICNDVQFTDSHNTFDCIYCDRKFLQENHLDLHMEIIHDHKALHCKVCTLSFPTEEILKAHMQSHSTGEYFQCPECPKTFTVKRYYLRHIRRHTRIPQQHSCDICFKMFSDPRTLQCHKRIHTDNECFTCEFCDKKFTQRSYRNRHVKRVHGAEEKHQCEVCSKTFTSKYYLQSHRKLHTEDECYVCPFCNKKFGFVYMFKKHIKHMHSPTKPEFECDSCSNSFSSIIHLNKHRESHENDENRRCPFCQKKYACPNHCGRHMMICPRRPKGQYQCHNCPQSFPEQEQLNEHLLVHADSGNFICPQCCQEYSTITEYRNHIDMKHAGIERKYRCEVCTKSFSKNSHLRRHQLSHNGNTVPCPHCDKKFISKSHCNRHCKRIHYTVGRPFTCDICSKSFAMGEDMAKHKKIHTRLETHVCPYCQQIFTNRPEYNQHITREHIKSAIPSFNF